MSKTTGSAPSRSKKSVVLSGVIAGNTAICSVGRTGNDLHYRGYDILDMADSCEFEEIAYLLVHEKLPTLGEPRIRRNSKACVICLPALKPFWKRSRQLLIRWM